VGEPEAKIPLRRSLCMWKNNIKMDLTETGCVCMYCINLDQDREQWRALLKDCNEP
jgi:hypothetical protein